MKEQLLEVRRVEQPNIVLFLADQLRCDALGCYGNALSQTPNLDSLAADGVRFDLAFSTSPVCSPARASLLTGLYPHNHGVMLNTHIAPAWSRGLSTELPNFAGLLKQAGYVLDYAGKWHVHEDLGPTAFGFDRYERPQISSEPREGSEIYIDFPRGRQLVGGIARDPARHNVARFAEAGIRMLRQRAEGDRPFFLRIDTGSPHFPCLPPERWARKFDPTVIPPWENFKETFEKKPASHLRKLREWNLEDKDWSWWREVVARYYGEVAHIDYWVGRVLEAIDQAGIADRTVFVFTADHGDAMGSHRHFEKAGTMYDEIFRIPLLMRLPPGMAGVGEVGAFVRLLDVMPTFCELGRARVPNGVDGRSILPLLNGQIPSDWPDSVYAEHHGEVWGYHSQRMVRTTRWKYVYNPCDLDELYDLENDPGELTNLIDDPSSAEMVHEMKARLLGWNDATGDMFRWHWVRWNFPDPVRPSASGS